MGSSGYHNAVSFLLIGKKIFLRELFDFPVNATSL